MVLKRVDSPTSQLSEIGPQPVAEASASASALLGHILSVDEAASVTVNTNAQQFLSLPQAKGSGFQRGLFTRQTEPLSAKKVAPPYSILPVHSASITVSMLKPIDDDPLANFMLGHESDAIGKGINHYFDSLTDFFQSIDHGSFAVAALFPSMQADPHHSHSFVVTERTKAHFASNPYLRKSQSQIAKMALFGFGLQYVDGEIRANKSLIETLPQWLEHSAQGAQKRALLLQIMQSSALLGNERMAKSLCDFLCPLFLEFSVEAGEFIALQNEIEAKVLKRALRKEEKEKEPKMPDSPLLMAFLQDSEKQAFEATKRSVDKALALEPSLPQTAEDSSSKVVLPSSEADPELSQLKPIEAVPSIKIPYVRRALSPILENEELKPKLAGEASSAEVVFTWKGKKLKSKKIKEATQSIELLSYKKKPELGDEFIYEDFIWDESDEELSFNYDHEEEAWFNDLFSKPLFSDEESSDTELDKDELAQAASLAIEENPLLPAEEECWELNSEDIEHQASLMCGKKTKTIIENAQSKQQLKSFEPKDYGSFLPHHLLNEIEAALSFRIDINQPAQQAALSSLVQHLKSNAKAYDGKQRKSLLAAINEMIKKVEKLPLAEPSVKEWSARFNLLLNHLASLLIQYNIEQVNAAHAKRKRASSLPTQQETSSTPSEGMLKFFSPTAWLKKAKSVDDLKKTEAREKSSILTEPKQTAPLARLENDQEFAETAPFVLPRPVIFNRTQIAEDDSAASALLDPSLMDNFEHFANSNLVQIAQRANDSEYAHIYFDYELHQEQLLKLIEEINLRNSTFDENQKKELKNFVDGLKGKVLAPSLPLSLKLREWNSKIAARLEAVDYALTEKASGIASSLSETELGSSSIAMPIYLGSSYKKPAMLSYNAKELSDIADRATSVFDGTIEAEDIASLK